MSKRAIILLKAITHLLCLTPFVYLLRFYQSGALELNPDPVAYITHFTGDWALWMLLGSLAVTPLRRLSPRIAWLIRFRRLIGLYAFFYASLHLATYIFLFSGYDFAHGIAGIRSGHPAIVLNEWKQVWPTIWDDVLKRRFIQVGFLAWLILLSLAVTSPAFIMRAIGGKPGSGFTVWFTWRASVESSTTGGCVKSGVLTPWKVTARLNASFCSHASPTAL